MSKSPEKSVFIYKKGDPSDFAYLVEGGSLEVDFHGDNRIKLPADNIIVGTLEYFLEEEFKTRISRLFDLSISGSGNYKKVPFETVNQMMMQFKFGANTNIFIARLIEYCNSSLTQKSKTPLGPIKRYQRKAALFARKVDLLFDLGIRHNISQILSISTKNKLLEVYRDGSLYPHYSSVDAITSPGKDKSKYVKFFKKNTLICREGNSAKELYVLLDGNVNVTIDSLYVASITTPGEVFGEMSLFLEKKRTASLIAESDAYLYVVPYSQVGNFAQEKCPELFIKIAQILSKRFIDTLQRMVKLDNLILKAQEKNVDKSFYKDLEEAVEVGLSDLKRDLKKATTEIKDLDHKYKVSNFLTEQFS